MKWNHIVIWHVFKRVRLKGVDKKLSKYGIFLKNSQNTACQITIWFHFRFGLNASDSACVLCPNGVVLL